MYCSHPECSNIVPCLFHAPPSPARSPSSQLQQRAKACDFAYFFSDPLCGDFTVIKSLDISKELRQLLGSLRDSEKAVRIRVEVATLDSFRSLITTGIRVLHYSGHGDGSWLVFENGVGKVHLMQPAQLQALVAGAGIELAFVSASSSEPVGRALAQAGIPHVIAVKNLVDDQSAIAFMKQFYLAVLIGKTVQEAFEIAKSFVKVAATAHSSHFQFVLLPEEANHSVRILQDVAPGELSVWEHVIPHNLVPPTINFLGRNFVTQELVEMLGQPKKRLIILTGPPKIGKSVLALETARYVHRRRMFDAVWRVDFTLNSSTSLLEMILEKAQTSGLSAFPHVSSFPDTGRALVILDNIDSRTAEEASSIVTRLQQLGVTLLITCRQAMNIEFACSIEVKPLAAVDAARLFYHSAARPLEPREYGAQGVHDAARLGHHRAIHELQGNPGKVIFAARKCVSGVELRQLPDLLDWSEWESFVVKPVSNVSSAEEAKTSSLDEVNVSR